MTAVKVSCRRNLIVSSLQIGMIAVVFVGLAIHHLPGQAPARTLIRAGHLLDVNTGAEPAEQTIVVVGDKIAAITPTASTSAGPSCRVSAPARASCNPRAKGEGSVRDFV